MIDFELIKTEEGPFAIRLAQWIHEALNPQSVLDIGCGPGLYVHALRDIGIDAEGIDTDERIDDAPYLHQESLLWTKRHASLVLCLEVAEHINDELEEYVVASVVKATDNLLIWSAAQPGQGGDGHVNCKPRAYWWHMIERHGLSRDPELERELLEYTRRGTHMGWFLNNAMVFRKKV